jgi:tRNA(Ile)-lysidine synthase TilS/MesJ
VAEIAVSLGLDSVALLYIVNILEAAAILVVFMHIKTVWSSKETH